MNHRYTLLALAAAALSAGAHATGTSVTAPWGEVAEPSLPADSAVCKTLSASITPIKGSVDSVDGNPANSQLDASRIQSAIDNCPAGQAVKLVKGSAGESGFLSGSLKLKSGVTLWIDSGVTLFASRNPADYDNGLGTCGTATTSNDKSCNALIVARDTAGSGIVGAGAIDGRGGSLVTSGPNANRLTWWDIAYLNKTKGLNQQNPRLIQTYNGSAFTLYGVTVQNSPNFHIVTTGTSGVTAWGIKIVTPSLAYTVAGYKCPSGTTPDKVTPATCFTPETVKNTDGFDPGQSTNVVLAYSYISTGDDHVAVKASSGPTRNLLFAHNHFYYGHGLSIGSETNTGVSNMLVTDLTMDGNDSSAGNGLRIKSDASRGGKVTNIVYDGICMRNVKEPLVFDPFYSSAKGSLYPNFTNIVVKNFHDLGSAKSIKRTMTFLGYEANKQKNPLTITLDNVVFDGTQPAFEGSHYGGPASPNGVHFTFGGTGPVSFANAIVTSSTTDVTVTGSPGTAAAVDCSKAFVPLKSVVPTSPI
ncbi:glycoside hydrolase family 28 protein [Ralstonia solanacearum]|uniref:glycoside hydrolase family 28 protein n=1 Tax=Ralstonia solanacearum TaxID=305 RepID=UPI0023054DEB|nr:glycoside hydrolase family 28 protein [Ralstonia solanacearum]MDB0567630.1 glycoside hydrolase family 28 protein [Ralstonia solanacearum]MDB0577660.1 glycoside hydrolase family 28 protein [Ralstonia solanacearum]